MFRAGGAAPQTVSSMAQAEHLPIYEEQVVQGFSRYHKYSLGADLRDGARRLLKLVVRANSRRDKAPEIREEAEQLKVCPAPLLGREGVPELQLLRARDPAGDRDRQAE